MSCCPLIDASSYATESEPPPKIADDTDETSSITRRFLLLYIYAQSPSISPNHLPQSTSTYLFNPPFSQPPPPVFQITPSVLFAALFNLIERF